MKTIYCVSVDYGGADAYEEFAFANESDRNEIALSFAEELVYANFNLNIAFWLTSDAPAWKEQEIIKDAIGKSIDWHYAQHVGTWEMKLYE